MCIYDIGLHFSQENTNIFHNYIIGHQSRMEGELVHDGDNSRSDIIFPDSLSFRKFVFSLPRFMACDILEWSWTQRLEDGKLYHIFSPNISVYMNGVYGTGHANIKPLNGQSRKMYALEDIKKDDEIIYQKVRVC